MYSAPSAKFCGADAEGRTSVVPSPRVIFVGVTRVRSAVSGIPTKRIVPVAEQPVVQQPEQNDQIESEPIEQPKKKLSTGAVIGGAAGVLALGGAGLGIALKKRRGKYEVS